MVKWCQVQEKIPSPALIGFLLLLHRRKYMQNEFIIKFFAKVFGLVSVSVLSFDQSDSSAGI